MDWSHPVLEELAPSLSSATLLATSSGLPESHPLHQILYCKMTTWDQSGGGAKRSTPILFLKNHLHPTEKELHPADINILTGHDNFFITVHAHEEH